ncbi:hypothetical protein SAMN05444359_101227 [Neolewinella agarilytica]|uniref:Uncharacterized protein n=1 Tax=Neolewinella agarilytica TaxID=478744 RepID=A0A1H8ZBG1_9BACT|nr:hypothetical protein SAMN05444359_101227 [Neolewinella agarilytica]
MDEAPEVPNTKEVRAKLGVLILLVMDEAPEDGKDYWWHPNNTCLNPSCDG